jgi:hypothetical protein
MTCAFKGDIHADRLFLNSLGGIDADDRVANEIAQE